MAASLALLGSSCSKSRAAVAGPGVTSGGESCGKRFQGVMSYLERFRDADVLPTTIQVPPAEGRAGRPLASDPRRHLLQCDASACWMGARGQKRAAFGGVFDRELSLMIGPTCGTVYLALPDTEPKDRVDRVLKVLNSRSCTAYAVVRRSLTGLPPVEPSEGMQHSLKRLLDAKPGSQQEQAQTSFGMTVVQQHAKSCGGVAKLVGSLAKVTGHRKYELMMGELAAKPASFRDCACSLPGDDDKVLFQFLTFNRHGADLPVYEARRLPTGPVLARSAKIWYDVVHTLSP